MSGVTVLYSYAAAPINSVAWAWFSLILVLIIMMYAVGDDHQPMAAVITLVMIFVVLYIVVSYTPTLKLEEVVVDDTASFNEVVEKYNPYERRGDMWVMEVIEKGDTK